MQDQLGNTVQVGDTVLYPGGSARFGGLKLMVGVVVKMTPTRLSLLTCAITSDGSNVTQTAKTSAKVLRCEDPKIAACPAIQALMKKINDSKTNA